MLFHWVFWWIGSIFAYNRRPKQWVVGGASSSLTFGGKNRPYLSIPALHRLEETSFEGR